MPNTPASALTRAHLHDLAVVIQLSSFGSKQSVVMVIVERLGEATHP